LYLDVRVIDGMRIVRILFIIAICWLLEAPALGSETSGHDQVKENRTDSTVDEWERDPDWVKARELEQTGIERIMGKRNRIELDLGYDYLSDNYGNWKNIRLMYLRRELTFVYFFELESFFRKEGNGLQLVGGIYKDWNKWLYTYTALAAGTNVEYLPHYRLDHDFNFKFGKKINYVFTVGGTYIDYHINHRDWILSAGLTGYFNKWILGYRIFRNISYPGSVSSFSHTFNVTYGSEGTHWTSLVFSFGKQAYNATELVTPERINRNSHELLFKHRHWIGKNWGLYGETSIFHLNDEYTKYGLTLGVFWDF
jgi:YaiO family outer membrane protein